MAEPIGVGPTGANASLIVDDGFRAQIPPLAGEELALLEESLRRDGCRDPIVVWLGHNIILDGHHRFDICNEYDIPFRTISYLFDSREAAADWIDSNQLGRRNLTPEAMSLLRGRRYNRTKKLVGVRGPEKLAQSEPTSTASTLATAHGVSPATIKRDGVFAKSVEALKPHVPDIEQRVMAGKVPSRDVVVQAAKDLEKAPEKAKAAFNTAAHFSSESSEHYTPAHIVAAVDLCLRGIDLDPCSNSKSDPNVPAAHVFTVAENGLTRPWSGTVYMNPPYGSEIKAWIEKLVHEYEDGDVSAAIALVPARPDTGWFLALANYPVCFVSGRLTFIGNESPAPFPSALVYLGRDPERFHEVFERTGIIRCRWAPGMVLNMMCPHGIDIGDFCAACNVKEKARKQRGKTRVA